MRANVEFIFKELKINGAAAGNRINIKDWVYEEAYVFSKSLSIGFVIERPVTVLTSIGKKVIITTTAAFECQSKPNHIIIIGAIPTIGIAEIKFPIGNKPLLKKRDLSIIIATIKALPHPIKYPDNAAFTNVWTKSAHNVSKE